MRGKVTSWVWLAIGLVVVTRSAANVYRLWKAGERVKEAENKLVQVKQENEQLALQWKEAQTPEYMERLVREKLGYGKPGEIVLVMPEGVASPSAEASEGPQPNWLVWRKLYLGF